jgi:phage baseplate assembly protein W
MELAFPYRIEGSGRTAGADGDPHIRHLLEMVLFTAPGERVNRPTFGCGLGRLVFEPGGEAAAAAVQFQVQAALQQWLGSVLRADSVRVAGGEGRLEVEVAYTVLESQRREVARFVQEADP